MSDSLLQFRRLTEDEAGIDRDAFLQAALDKLQTLYPGKKTTVVGTTTISMETDSIYAENGMENYDIGLLDGEIPALRRMSDGEVFSFRV